MDRWVVFDYGEVISRRTAELPSLAALLQVGAEEFERAYWAERERYDQGLPDADYWRAVAAHVGRTVDDALVERLTTLDVEGWLNTDPATIALLDEVRGQGVPLAMLSNASSTFGRAVERQPWAPWFEHLLFSGDLGIAKPDPRIWRILTDALGAAPEDCSFFDDREDNIAAARAAGIDAHVWESAAEAKRLIEEI